MKTLYTLLFASVLANFLAATYLPAYSSSFVSFLPLSNVSNVADQDGNTALHLAAISSKTECMRVLLKAGATDSLSLGKFIITYSYLPLQPSSCQKGYSPWKVFCEPAFLCENVAKQQ